VKWVLERLADYTDNQDEKLSVEEIGEQLGMAPSTVRNEHCRLRWQDLVVAARYTVGGKARRLSKWWRMLP
jgi:IS30 family transposase